MRFAIFFIVIITLWTGLHAYIVWRAASVPAIARHVPAWALVAVAAFLWASFLAGRLLDRPVALVDALEWASAYWVGVLFVTFVCLLAADLVTGFGFLWRSHAPALRGWGLVAAGALSAVALVQGMRAPVVRDYEVSLANLPADADGLVIVVVSDTHLGTMIGEGWVAARVAQVEALRGDLLVMAGDIIEGHGSPERLARITAALSRFHAPLGVWAVFGNHETYAGIDKSTRVFHDAGFRLLRDEWAEVRPGLVLAGVSDEADPAPVLAALPAGRAVILLSHRPTRAEAAARAGAGLMLSGHVHNGQIWPFGYIVARMNEGRLGGRYDVDGMPLIVCRGAGTWGPRMRLWYPCEILRITLRAPR